MTSSRATQVHPGEPVTSTATRRARGSITGSRRPASCCSRCPASRCSIRASSSSPPCSAAGNGRAPSIPGSASCCSSASSGCSSASGRPISGSAEDGTWLARLRDVLTGHEEKLPEVGKYNAGQKIVFWAMSILIIILISQRPRHLGPVFRRSSRRIEQKRIAVLVHCDRGGGDHLRLDRPCLCRDLGARHDQRHDPRPGHRRLGLAASSQMAAGTGHRQAAKTADAGATPAE